MGSFFARFGRWSRRQWVIGGILVMAVACLIVLVGPQPWAAYHYRAGIAALERYHSADARDHFQSCLSVWKNNVSARVYLSRACRRLGDYSEARKRLKECQTLLKGSNQDVALEDALLRASMGQLGELETTLRTRMEREPINAPLILEALAEGYARMYRMLECMACLTQWLDFDPDNVQAHFLRGRAYQQIPAFDKAATEYRKVLELDPDRLEAREPLVTCLLEISRFEEALGHLEWLQRQNPDNPDLQVSLARCYQGMGQFRKPREILESLVSKHPDHGPALLLLGRIILSSGHPEDAENWLRKAAEKLPYDYQAQWQLYNCLKREEGKSAEAQAQLARAEALRQQHLRLTEITRQLAVRPHDAKLHYEIGNLMMKVGKKDLGARWLSSALHEKADYPEARDALIAYFEETGHPEEAEQLRQDALAGSTEEEKR